MLTESAALEAAVGLRRTLQDERGQLDVIRAYWKGKQPFPATIPEDAPVEVRAMARVSRINVIDLIVQSLAQGLFVDGLRSPANALDSPAEGEGAPEDPLAPVWRVWQGNRMDRGQNGLHRAACAYGTAYMAITPGDPGPVMRPASPRLLTAQYGADPDWPVLALEKRPTARDWLLYDSEGIYQFGMDGGDLVFRGATPHELGYTPIVRYRDAEDLDLDDDIPVGGLGSRHAPEPCTLLAGQVAPMMSLQDAINLTSFSLKAAEWYGAFRQRWAIGWTPSDRTEKMKAASSQLWTFEDDPENIKLGEFSDTPLDGFLSSRISTMRFAATLSQTPVHELSGELINMAAEALAAAEAGHDRKIKERKTGFGESHEQSLSVVGALIGVPVPVDAEVIWQDSSARAFAATVDGLGKLAQMLEVPVEELWDRIPGVTQQDVDRWRDAKAAADLVAKLNGALDGDESA